MIVLYINMIVLPRQTRDTHRENTQKRDPPFHPQVPAASVLSCSGGQLQGTLPGEKNVLFAPFIYKNDHFTKTGSGQT